jgi:predicted RNase H-like nuclease
MALLAPNGLAVGPVPAFIQLFVLIRIFKYKYKQKTSLNESARHRAYRLLAAGPRVNTLKTTQAKAGRRSPSLSQQPSF